MASWEPVDIDPTNHDGIDFENKYDKVHPIDDADLNESMAKLNESIRERRRVTTT